MGAVADRVDGGVRGARGEIDDDAVGAVQPGGARQRIVRRRTDADQHRVAGNCRAVRQAHPGDPAGRALECLHRGVQDDAHAGVGVTALEEIRQRRRRHARQDP